MTPSERDTYSWYRLEKAEEAYQAAEVLVANGQWNASINRLYYAAYYAVSGLLVKAGVETKTHAGVKTQFLLYFVKTGRMLLVEVLDFDLLSSGLCPPNGGREKEMVAGV